MPQTLQFIVRKIPDVWHFGLYYHEKIRGLNSFPFREKLIHMKMFVLP